MVFQSLVRIQQWGLIRREPGSLRSPRDERVMLQEKQMLWFDANMTRGKTKKCEMRRKQLWHFKTLKANLTQQWLQRYGREILPHPAHSPDLAPSDFHLFGPLKRHLGGMAFETEDDLISELRNWFDNLDVDFFRVGINSLLPRWQKCIDLHGDYVEK
ncbi:low-density lipoprotein receptor-related protein 4 [Plakobranchus ocellatus]|uniref:Low-density lipoprotein receptor-related protein 4 n=1 Tax=Plakobranchus ocellatus TaxID=259542 RepID=A0AAV3Z466_9GAST|nr:low-density lipoprotein receptor-related protein 4 [Plakobranchus ocellatus]